MFDKFKKASEAKQPSTDEKEVHLNFMIGPEEQKRIIAAIKETKNAIIDETDFASPQIAYPLHRILKIFDFSMDIISSIKREMDNESASKFFRVLEFTEARLINKANSATTKSEESEAAVTALGIARIRAILLGRATLPNSSRERKELFLPILKSVQNFIKQDTKEKIKAGGSKKEIKAQESVSISALNKMISKLERKKEKPLTPPEELSLLYNLFDVKRELSDPAKEGKGRWMGLDRHKVEDLMALIYE